MSHGQAGVPGDRIFAIPSVIVCLFVFNLLLFLSPQTRRRGVLCGQVTPKNPQEQDSLSKTYRQFFFFFPQKQFGVRVSEAFLIACWILQIPLPADYALSLVTVPRDLAETGKQKWPTAFSGPQSHARHIGR